MHFLALLPMLAMGVQASLTYKGVDWSSTLIAEAAGITWKNSAGTSGSLESILKAAGVNTVRQRLWVDPTASSYYDLAYNLKLAKRAHAAGLNIYLDIFFSETWTDPSNQATPSAWANYDIGDLAWEVYNYTLSVADSFESAGIPLSLVAIGNEITEGLLWPLGELSNYPYNTAELLHSASAGIKASTLATQPKIIIHTDNGWNWATQEWWYATVLEQGPLVSTDYDIQGVSYYPFYNSAATLASLKTSLTNLHSKYGKETMVVETNWPVSCPKPAYSFPSDTTSIPFSAAGQSTWLKDVAAAVEAASGTGLFYWEPAWVENGALGSSCSDNLMFSYTGEAYSSLSTFASL